MGQLTAKEYQIYETGGISHLTPNHEKLLAVGLGLLMAFQTMPVFAGTFNDLKASEWAESYIEKMASKGIITGFNGAYNPTDPVNKYSAVVMIYRTLKAAGKLEFPRFSWDLKDQDDALLLFKGRNAVLSDRGHALAARVIARGRWPSGR